MRTVFLGTPEFAVAGLEVLHQHTEVVAVLCQPDKPAGRGMKLRPPPVKKRALELGLEVLQPPKIRSKAFRQRFRELAPELALVAAYGKILPQSLLDEVPRGFINLHASLLPRFRGAAPIHRCILEGERETGISVMHLTAGMDEGPVYLEKRLSLAPDETVGSLHDRLRELSREATEDFLAKLLSGALPDPIEQDHARATYAPKIEAEEARVDWQRGADELDRHLRGMDPFPGAFSHLEGRRIKLFRARPDLDSPGLDLAPGSIVGIDAEGIRVACGQGALVLLEVQPSGKRRILAADWARGARLEVGTRFEDPEPDPAKS